MTLNRADFPEMTDEQWNAIVAESDRRATEAAETARKKAEKTAESARQAAIDTALEAERARMEASETERLELDRKAIADDRAALAAERKSLTASKKLAAAGLPDEKIQTLLPMFVAVDDKVLDATLDTFVETYQTTVKSAVDAEKKALLEAATPPSTSPNAPVEPNAVVGELIAKGNDLMAIDALITAASTAGAPQS